MSTSEHPPTEEELRAAYEAEIKKIRVEQILLENIVTLVNLGMRRTGLAPGTEGERDPEQVKLAIEAIRSLLPLLEQSAPQQIAPIRDALSQLQMAYVRIGGAGAPEAGAEGTAGGGGVGSQSPAGDTPRTSESTEPPPANPEEPGPAQRSGRLWVPGQ
jgi:hypothetical protein